MNGVPDCEALYENNKISNVLCKPYVQVFMQNKMIYSSLEKTENTLESLHSSDQ